MCAASRMIVPSMFSRNIVSDLLSGRNLIVKQRRSLSLTYNPTPRMDELDLQSAFIILKTSNASLGRIYHTQLVDDGIWQSIRAKLRPLRLHSGCQQKEFKDAWEVILTQLQGCIMRARRDSRRTCTARKEKAISKGAVSKHWRKEGRRD